jgi:tetratricopeptide (TPR) repeat protein
MKRIFSAVLACLMLFTLCACGGKAQATYQEQYDLGVKYLSEGNYEQAVIAFTAAIQIDPKQAPAYTGRGDAYVQLAASDAETAGEKYENAVTDYQQSIKLDGGNAEVYLKLAEIYITLGDTDSAEEILQQGYDATGDESLQARLEELLPPEAAHEIGDAEFTVQGKTLTLSLTDPDLRESYAANLATTDDDQLEYTWDVDFTDGNHSFEVGTMHFKEPGSSPTTLTPAEMQSDLWLVSGSGGDNIGEAVLSISGNTLSWSFTVPDEYAFAYDNIQITGTDIVTPETA